MRITKLFPALLTVSLVSVPALARAEGAAKAPAAAGAKGARGKAAKSPGQLEARVLKALQKQGIDEVRAQRVVLVMKKARQEQRVLRQDSQKHREALRGLLSQKSTDEGAYAKALDGLDAARKKSAQIRDRQISEIRKILKPSEQAKVLRLIRQRGGGRAE